MKFILNTAVDPHFCSLFDVSGKRLAYHEWKNRRDDGKEIWQFLQHYTVSEITFLGGVSGPGGFSSLRAGASILNALAFVTHLSVASIRADFWQEALLSGKGKIVLNSFGDGVWIQSGKDLVRKSIEQVRKQFRDTPVCVNWLPGEKAEQFQNPVFVDMKNAPEVLMSLLEKEVTHPQFITDYEVPPV